MRNKGIRFNPKWAVGTIYKLTHVASSNCTKYPFQSYYPFVDPICGDRWRVAGRNGEAQIMACAPAAALNVWTARLAGQHDRLAVLLFSSCHGVVFPSFRESWEGWERRYDSRKKMENS
jgi:hypothetical protein